MHFLYTLRHVPALRQLGKSLVVPETALETRSAAEFSKENRGGERVAQRRRYTQSSGQPEMSRQQQTAETILLSAIFSESGAPLRRRMLARYAKSLPVFLRGVQSLFAIGERTCNVGLQSPTPVLKGCTAFFWNSLRQISNERVHAPHDLHAGSPIKADPSKASRTRSSHVGKGITSRNLPSLSR